MIRLTLLLLLCSISGCVSVSVDALPDSASEIDFSETVDSTTGWRTGEKSHTFYNTGGELVFAAAKAALVHEDYDVTTASLMDGVVFGERGMTAMKYNMVSGIYLNQLATETQTRVIVKGAIDLTQPTPNYSLDNEARKLLDAMHVYIDAELDAEPDSASQ